MSSGPPRLAMDVHKLQCCALQLWGSQAGKQECTRAEGFDLLRVQDTSRAGDVTLGWDNNSKGKRSCRPLGPKHKDHDKQDYYSRLNGFHEPSDMQRGVLDRQMSGEPEPALSAASNLVKQPSAAAAAAACAAVSGWEKDRAGAHTLVQLCANGPLTRAVDAVVDLAAEKHAHVVSTSLLCTLLQRCGTDKNLALGQRLDELTVKLGYASDAYLGNHIVRMYACQGRLQDATKVFTRVARPSGHMWFSIISAHTRHGRPRRAIQLYHEMRSSGFEPNSHIFVAALQACAREGDLECGRQVHSHVVGSGVHLNCFLGNALVDMYAKCRDLEAGRRVFDTMLARDAVTWNTMINGYADHGLGLDALALHASMEQDGQVSATSVTFACLLKACASAGALQQGRHLHSQLVQRRLLEEGDVVLGTCLVNMYVKCGKLDDARTVFDSMAKTDAVAWNAMMSGYVERGLGLEALSLYARMEQQGMGSLADGVTYACLLKACASAGALQQGRQLHLQVVERGLLRQGDVLVGNSVVDMYAKCGQLEDARTVFDGLVARNAATWTAMINGYAEHGLGGEALTLYAKMEEQQQQQQQEGGLISAADSVTYACLLRACASAGALQQGKRLHLQVVEKGMLLPGGGDVVVGTCLVDMYVKCGEVEEAGRVFDSLATKNAVTWTAMINGYAEHGLGQQALTLYGRMEQEGLVVADSVTLACLLKACASAGAVRQGRRLHSQIVERGLLLGGEGGGGDDASTRVVMGTCLVNMYAKCGDLDSARAVFDSLAGPRDTVTWNAMIGGYGTNNDGHKAIACFEEMVRAGVPPDAATFTCLLGACSHEGLVTQGREYFDAITNVHGLSPTAEHYVCMVDLLGRAGHLAEAETMLLSTGAEEGGDPNAVGLMSLLNACKSAGDVARGTRCFERLVTLDPHNASAYVLTATMYAAADRWADADRVERLRKAAGASKKPAVAGIEVKARVHTFVVGEAGGADGVAGKARRTSVRLKDEWNRAPQTGVVVKPGLSEAAKEDQLCGHAEKLALAYGLLHTPDGAPLLVTKNLRMCGDCHSATEVVSRVESRAIVVRDSHRVHRFEAGFCTCKGRC